MTEDIQFVKFNASNHDLDCANGEIRPPKGIVFCDDGSLSMETPNTSSVAKLPEGVTPIYIHRTGAATNVIATDGNSIIWATLPCECDTLTIKSFTKIADTAHVNDTTLINGVIVVATDEGLLYIKQKNNGYECTHHLKTPEIEFGLQKAGNLSNKTEITITSNSTEKTDGILPNSTMIGISTSTSEISETVAKAFEETVASQITTKGYFHMPFFIRYALRLYDGTHIMPSSPVLMLPMVLPPCIGLTITNDTDNNIIRINPTFSKVIYHQLRYRIKTADMESLKSVIAAIDIFCTPMIPTYDVSRINQGYVTTYAQVIEAGHSPIRGRQNLDTGSNAAIYEGHYSIADDNYTDHYLEQSVQNTPALMLYPNTQLHEQIIEAAEYRLIASISINDLCRSDDFAPVPTTPMPDKGTHTYNLSNEYSNLFDILASSLYTINGHLMAATKALLPKTGIIPFTIPYFGNYISASDVYTDIEVRFKINNHEYTLDYSCQMDHYLSEHFPRYIYIPHRSAYRVLMRQGENTYAISLTPHPTLNGAYWYGGISDVEPPATNLHNNNIGNSDKSADKTGSIPSEMILVSGKDNAYVFDESQTIKLDDASITTIIEATKSPKYGSFGKYSAYAFTSSGIWMLEYSDSQQKFISRHKIHRDKCVYPDTVTTTDDVVIYATDTSIKRLDGSDSQSISLPLSAMRWDISKLPLYDELLSSGCMEQIETSLSEIIKNGIIYFDAQSSTLMLSPKDSEYTLVYHNGSWSVLDLQVTCTIKSNTTLPYLFHPNQYISLLRDTHHATSSQKGKAFIVTRPIKSENRKIRSVKILGDFAEGKVTFAIYGAKTYGHWHLCASSINHYAQIHTSEPYCLYILAIMADLDDYEYITGASIEYL